ncbi:MAG: hypothetical protein HQ523_03395 [Lentisphaerae bacterium]|nr:hypothetical protein [Lentisphaerota bacterium]
MTEDEVKALQSELAQFQQEKEQIKSVIGTIGGNTTSRQDGIISTIFVVMISLLFLIDLLHLLNLIHSPLPPLFSLQIGVLLVSIKIIWMMHKQMKVEHFQFWILNSIEFRINDIAKKQKRMEEMLKARLTE